MAGKKTYSKTNTSLFALTSEWRVKTLDVLSLLRPIVHDTSKTAKITWFLLVLHWAMDVMTSITSTVQMEY